MVIFLVARVRIGTKFSNGAKKAFVEIANSMRGEPLNLLTFIQNLINVPPLSNIIVGIFSTKMSAVDLENGKCAATRHFVQQSKMGFVVIAHSHVR